MNQPIVLSHKEAAPLLDARQADAPLTYISPDLGLSMVEVALYPGYVQFPNGAMLAWDAVEEIIAAPTKCFVLHDDSLEEIRVFSEQTQWVRSLMPTSGVPTMLVSGFPMHRIKDIDPYTDTLRKLKTIAPITGRVLDTATGLGYTAIEAAKTATEVVTIELDPASLEIARLNPWSQALFTDPKIKQIFGDAYDEVQHFEASSFSRIIHDPPIFSLAGELYSGAFYKQLFRVLKQKGRLFHYIGDPESASGRRIFGGVIRRLRDAGFSRVVQRPEAFGVVAYK
jgi:predicted methyltransferase